MLMEGRPGNGSLRVHTGERHRFVNGPAILLLSSKSGNKGDEAWGKKYIPKGFRIGVIEGWESRWFAEKEYANFLHDDIQVRDFIKKRLQHAGIAKIEIERAANKAKINIHTARPGIVIGKKGAEIEKLKTELAKLSNREVYLNIHEVRRPDLDAQFVSENVALQLERRVAFRRAMKECVDTCYSHGGARSEGPVFGAIGGSRNCPYRMVP